MVTNLIYIHKNATVRHCLNSYLIGGRYILNNFNES